MDGLPPNAPTSFNAIGSAWTLGITNFTTTPHISGDVARAGRGFSPLQVGQTLKVIIDNPTDRSFFRGYFVRFNGRNGLAGDGNICYGGAACSPGTSPKQKLNVNTFEYFTYGQWGVGNGDPGPNNKFSHLISDPDLGYPGNSLFDTDTAAAGAEIDVTALANDQYTLKFTPFGNPAGAYTETGPLADPGQPIDWLEFTFFNKNAQAGVDSEFFIHSIEIDGAAAAGVPGDYNSDGVVDAADYVVWRNHLGTNFQLPNEVSGTTPGSVTQEDYAAWRARFGNTSGAGSGFSAGSVPEPGMLGLFLAAVLSMCASGWRRISWWRW
jgi:hypothetical protein